MENELRDFIVLVFEGYRKRKKNIVCIKKIV